jgi:hypothetical protein
MGHSDIQHIIDVYKVSISNSSQMGYTRKHPYHRHCATIMAEGKYDVNPPSPIGCPNILTIIRNNFSLKFFYISMGFASQVMLRLHHQHCIFKLVQKSKTCLMLYMFLDHYADLCKDPDWQDHHS